MEATNHQEVLQEYDIVTREGISHIIRVPLIDHQWLQANLPVPYFAHPDEDPNEALSPALLHPPHGAAWEGDHNGSLEGMS